MTVDVVVVGLGLAGVAALRKLHDAGIEALGLEAANRLGGRVKTIAYGNGKVDTGGQWLEGENIIYDMLKDLSPPLIGPQDQREQVFLLSNGTELAQSIGYNILKEFGNIISGADVNSKKSIPGYLSEAVQTNARLMQEPEVTDAFIELYKGYIHNGHQEDRRSKSLRGIAESWPLKGGLLPWKGNGFQTLIDILLNAYPNPAEKIPVDIQLNKEVSTINWQQPGGAPVEIRCKDGSVYRANKYVIVTVSVGVLKDRHEQLFNPPLPAEKINAIDNLQMSVIDKIYIEFAKPWWPTDISLFSTIWRPEDKAKFSEQEWWVTQVYRLSLVDSQPNLLCAWVVGEGAKAMEKDSEEGVRKGIEKVLDTFFRKKYDVSDIVSIYRTQWGIDPLNRGAYGYRCVDTEVLGGSASALGAPLYSDEGVPVVLFAGEATSPHHHGAMHGAIESGFHEAERIVHLMERAK